MVRPSRFTSVLSLLTLGASTTLSGCGDDEALPTGAAAPPSPLERLEQVTGTDWALLLEPDRTVFLAPVDAEPPRPEAMHAPETVARTFLREHGDVLAIDDADAELVAIGVDPGPEGAHVAFLQVSGDLVVEGAMVLVHFEPDGGIRSINGRYVPGLSALDRSTPLSPEDARQRVEEALPLLEPDFDASWLDPEPQIELVIAVDAHRPAAMAYSVEVTLKGGRELTFIVHATSGAAYVTRDSRVHATVPGSGRGVWGERDIKTFPVTAAAGQFELRQPATAPSPSECGASIGQPEISIRRADSPDVITGDVVKSTDPNSWETDVTPGERGMAVDAYAHLRMAETYFRERHCRWSWDGVGGPVEAVVSQKHPTEELWALFDHSWKTFGFWAGGVYGWGNVMPGSGAVDVVAHEYTHAVISAVRQCSEPTGNSALQGVARRAERCSEGPRTRGESGALDEGLADVFGNLAERYQTVDDANNLLFGERVFCSGNPFSDGDACAENERKALRDLADPKSHGGFEHMHQFNYVDDDGDGKDDNVHLNGGIIGKAFAMMTVGGGNDISKITIPKGEAIGWAKAEWLWYKALPTLYFTATFSAFANQTIKLAPLGGVERAPVACAWVAVGVLYGDDVEKNWKVQCPESAAHDDLLGHWDWTHGNWGTMSFASSGDGTKKHLVRGVYTYRDGSTLLACDESMRNCAGVWFEGSRNCTKLGDHGPATFELLTDGTVNGRWAHLDQIWGENWDLEKSSKGIPPEDLARLKDDSLFVCP